MVNRSVLDEVHDQYKDILENSAQAIYIYLDDEHKLCNEKFASMLGYDSADEWARVSQPFTEAFVDEKSQHTLVHAYQHAMQDLTGSAVPVTWKMKAGKRVATQVILVPIAHSGELMALHFVKKL